MFLAIGLILLLLWLGGFFVFHVTAFFIHILLYTGRCFHHLSLHARCCFGGLRTLPRRGAEVRRPYSMLFTV